jgi:predicted metal-dependent phosphoesterase TrpH
MLVDLHLHTTVSDGELDPCDLLAAIAAIGITHASIADHDALGAYSWEGGRVFREALRLGIDLRPGIELDATLEGIEVHLLGYDVRSGSNALDGHLARVRAARTERARREIGIVQQLLGADAVTEGEIFAPGRETFMKPHFIHPLLAKGLFPSYEAAIGWYKGNVRSGVEVEKPPLAEAIRLVHEAGGWAVLAHPAYYEKAGIGVTTRLGDLAKLGLDGVEVEYPYHLCSPTAFSPAEERDYVVGLRDEAVRLGLRITRGSDGHTRADLDRVYGSPGRPS